MQYLKQVKEREWPALMKRPALDRAALDATVDRVFEAVKQNGDDALRAFSRQFDGLDDYQMVFSKSAIAKAAQKVPARLAKAIDEAFANIEAFHAAQKLAHLAVETTPGIRCERRAVPVNRVGLYVPGGTAPLFSSLLMLGIPARLAGCSQITVCTPPRRDHTLDPALAYVAQSLALDQVFACGGAQAVAAMSYGTATIPAVDKIFGPGNQYLTRAKERAREEGLAIDMPAGPSEVLVIADGGADPTFIAADLLSQAEHGADSQVFLLSPSADLIEKTLVALSEQLKALPRAALANEALAQSKALLMPDLSTCFDFSNAYAPEHLILQIAEARAWAEKVQCAGSVFLGRWTPESLGDYASGTNHTLPTNGYARNYSGVSLSSFQNFITFQEASRQGLEALGETVMTMAQAERLAGHAEAVRIRLNSPLK